MHLTALGAPCSFSNALGGVGGKDLFILSTLSPPIVLVPRFVGFSQYFLLGLNVRK